MEELLVFIELKEILPFPDVVNPILELVLVHWYCVPVIFDAEVNKILMLLPAQAT